MIRTIKLSEVDQWLVGLADALPKAAKRGLLTAAAKGTQVIKAQIIPNKVPQPVDRGVYKAGWQFRKTAYGADIYNAETTAPLIEYGVRASNIRPGRAMIAALTEWVIRKKMVNLKDVKLDKDVSRNVSRSTRQVLKKDILHAQAEKVAWAIVKSMQKKGIFNHPGPGMGIMDELIRNHLPGIIKQEVSFALAKELNK